LADQSHLFQENNLIKSFPTDKEKSSSVAKIKVVVGILLPFSANSNFQGKNYYSDLQDFFRRACDHTMKVVAWSNGKPMFSQKLEIFCA